MLGRKISHALSVTTRNVVYINYKFLPDVFRLNNRTKLAQVFVTFTTRTAPCFNSSVRWLSCSSNKCGVDYSGSFKCCGKPHVASTGTMTSETFYRQFCFDNYDIIGFDLDCTLIRFNLNEMMKLEYNCLMSYMVEQKKYSIKLLANNLTWDFLQKGLIIDTELGNILKLSSEGGILRGSHGTRFLSNERLEYFYGPERKWALATKFHQNPISTWNGPDSLKIRSVIDYFDMPAALVFAQTIDLIDWQDAEKARLEALRNQPPPPPPPIPSKKKKNKKKKHKKKGKKESIRKTKTRSTIPVEPPPPPKRYKVWKDVLDALVYTYSRENFGIGKSIYFQALTENIDRFVLRSSDEMLKFLVELRASGKSLFLLSGSHIDFVNRNARYAMGCGWQTLFDAVVTYARKPGFFTEKHFFKRIDMKEFEEIPDSEIPLEEILPLGEDCVYSQGNWNQLLRTLSNKLSIDPTKARVLYFGDNLIQDVYAPVKHANFETVAISEELLASDSQDCSYEYAHAVASKVWGSYFALNGKATMWSGLIANYAKLCIPMMENIIMLTPFCKSIRTTNPNGFYPIEPSELVGKDLVIKPPDPNAKPPPPPPEKGKKKKKKKK